MGEVKAWWMRAIFTRPAPPSDTRPFVVRLLHSVRLKVKKTKRGLTVWISGGADF
jgi:hypothetical protein